MSGEPLGCCECSLPVGNEGKMRAVLLVPCQHILHASCSEFIRKRTRIQQRLCAFGDESVVEPVTGTAETPDGRLVVCPACVCPIQRLIPLFLNGSNSAVRAGDDTRHGENDGNVSVLNSPQGASGDGKYTGDKLLFRQVLHRQQACIENIRMLYERRESVAQLLKSCAIIHARRTELEREIERLSSVVPNVAASASASHISGGRPPVESMTATELELYITQSSVEVSSLERQLRDQRSAMEKKLKRTNDLLAKYRGMRTALSVDGRGDVDVRVPREDSECKNPVEGGCMSANRGSDMRVEGPPCGNNSRPPFVVGSDDGDAVVGRHTLIISSGSSCCSNSDVEVRRWEEGSEELCQGDDRDDNGIIIIDDSPPHQPTAADGGSRGRGGDYNGNGGHTTGQAGHVAGSVGLLDEEEEHAMWHPRTSRIRPMFSPEASAPRVSRLLPRRHDRLFQSSLEGLW